MLLNLQMITNTQDINQYNIIIINNNNYKMIYYNSQKQLYYKNLGQKNLVLLDYIVDIDFHKTLKSMEKINKPLQIEENNINYLWYYSPGCVYIKYGDMQLKRMEISDTELKNFLIITQGNKILNLTTDLLYLFTQSNSIQFNLDFGGKKLAII